MMGAAFTLFSTRPESAKLSWSAARIYALTRLRPADFEEACIVALQSRVQLPGESVAVFAAELTKLLMRVEHEAENSRMVFYLRRGLRLDIRERLTYHVPEDAKDAWSFLEVRNAMHVESIGEIWCTRT
jgi:hypothetical protein